MLSACASRFSFPRRQLFILLTGLTFNLFVLTSAHAATYYVATNGSDSNPGTQAAPFKTIQKSVGVVRAGDTVIIKPGKYAPFDLKNINGAEGAQITFQGEQGSIIDRNLGGGNVLRNIEFYGGSYITIDGLELTDSDTVPPSPDLATTCKSPHDRGRNGIKINENTGGALAHHIVIKNMSIHGLRGQGILGAADYMQVLNNHIYDNGGKSKGWAHQGYGTYLMGKYMLIRGNHIHGNNGNGIRTGPGSTDLKKNLTDSIIENNLVYDNGGHFVHTGDGTECNLLNQGDGILIWHGSGNIIRNNIVYGNVSYGIRVNEDVAVNNKPNLVSNNTVYKNGVNSAGHQGIYCYDGEKTIVKNNISYLSGKENIFKGCTNQLSNNLTTDPKFVNPAAGDFGLLEGSPAINKGMELRAEVPDDFMGTKRPVDLLYDIGAFEGAGSKANVLPGVGAGIPPGIGGGGTGGGIGSCYK